MKNEPIIIEDESEDIAAEEQAEAFHMAVYTDFVNRKTEALIAKLQR